jgi:hypothetical protein
MKEQFVNHEIATLLKEKGFKEECMAFYEISIKAREDVHDGFSGPFGWKKGEVNFSKGYFENSGLPDNSNEYWLLCGAPLWQQVIDWLREKHSLDIMTRQLQLDGRAYYKISKIETEDKIKGYSNFCKSAYEAREKAIVHALTLI